MSLKSLLFMNWYNVMEELCGLLNITLTLLNTIKLLIRRYYARKNKNISKSGNNVLAESHVDSWMYNDVPNRYFKRYKENNFTAFIYAKVGIEDL